MADWEVFDLPEEPEEPPFDLLDPPSEDPPPPSDDPPPPSDDPPPPPSDELFPPLGFSVESPPDTFPPEEAASLSEEAAFL